VLLWGLSVWTLATGSLKAQAPPEPLQLIHADTLKQWVQDGQVVRKLIGHVLFRQGSTTLSCDEATQYVDERMVVFQGNVFFQDTVRTLTADELVYFERPEREIARGNVVIHERNRLLKADQVMYIEARQMAQAEGNVFMEDPESSLQLFAGKVIYDRRSDYGLATIKPRLIKLDSTGAREIVITGKKIEYYGRERRAVVSGDVKITKGDIVCRAEEAHYLDPKEKIIIRGQPLVFRKRDEMRGEEIELYLKQLELQKLHLIRNGELISRFVFKGEEKEDRLLGEDIWMFFQDEQVERIVVENQAISFYHVIEDSLYKGVNKVWGDRIVLSFSEGELKHVVVESAPDVSKGKFFPPQTQRVQGRDLNN